MHPKSLLLRLGSGLFRPKTRLALMASKRAFSSLPDIPSAKSDHIFGLKKAFNSDKDPERVNLIMGAYRDDDGESFVFPSVREAEKELVSSDLDMEYAPILGLADFNRESTILAYGKDMECVKKGNIACIQTLSGTGALRLAFDFLKQQVIKNDAPVYVSTPTYNNHLPILRSAGFNKTRRYAYYDKTNNSLDFCKMREDLEKAPEGSIVLMQVVAHNPTGTDLENKQWEQLAPLLLRKKHICVLDFAYQGFASGDPDADAFALRTLTNAGVDLLLCQSFAKNLGMYGHRAGCLSIPTRDSVQRRAIESQLEILARTSYSNPPLHGARLVAAVLRKERWVTRWKKDLLAVMGRMSRMRRRLLEELQKTDTKLDWSHLGSQRGMFCFTGMDQGQMEHLRTEWHVYGTDDGRISICGLTEKNVAYVAKAIHSSSR